jgi:hypothetical protein
MTRKTGLPPEDHVRAVMTRMLADAAGGGPRPTVLALARSLGLANTTFWRHYHDIATELRNAASGIPAPARGQNPRPGQAGELARPERRPAPRTRPPRQPARSRPQPPAAPDHRQRRTPP